MSGLLLVPIQIDALLLETDLSVVFEGDVIAAIKGAASLFTSAQFALRMIETSEKLRFQLTGS
jgi:hypothetical protein